MHTFEPMVILSRLSIQTFSPIQTLLPIDKNDGYLIDIFGFYIKPLPTVAPNSIKIMVLNFDGKGKLVLKISG